MSGTNFTVSAEGGEDQQVVRSLIFHRARSRALTYRHDTDNRAEISTIDRNRWHGRVREGVTPNGKEGESKCDNWIELVVSAVDGHAHVHVYVYSRGQSTLRCTACDNIECA